MDNVTNIPQRTVSTLDNGRDVAPWSRYFNVLDIGVLLAALLVFLLFLIFLIRTVFPQGSGFGEITFEESPVLLGSHERGGVGLAGTNVSSSELFHALLGDVFRDVKIRRVDSIAWGSADIGITVRNGDAVQTFESAWAQVDFTTDNELRIGANSLIVFSNGAADPFLEKRDPAVVILDGELTATINADYGAFSVEFPAGLVELTAEKESDAPVNFRIGVNADKSSTISVLTGQADVNVAGDHYLVTANHGLTIAENGKSGGVRALPPPPSIYLPNNHAVVKYLGAPPRVNFRWSRVSSADNYRLEIAKDSEFEELLVDEFLQETSFTHGNLAPGDYYWRISARDGWTRGPSALPRRLVVMSDSEPPPLELQPIQHVSGDRYVLRGKTAIDAKVYVLGNPVTTSPSGNFEYFLNPEPGTQSIVVESIDAVGNVAYNSQVLHVPGIARRSE